MKTNALKQENNPLGYRICQLQPAVNAGGTLFSVSRNTRAEAENTINEDSGIKQLTIPNQCKMFQQKYPLGVQTDFGIINGTPKLGTLL